MSKTRTLINFNLLLIVFIIVVSLFFRIDAITANGFGPIQRFNTNLVFNEYSKYDTNLQNANSINVIL